MTAASHESRMIDFDHIFNFRDLGGLVTEDGRTVRSGLVYRSDMLGRLSESERERFGKLNIHTVIDLRRQDELDKHGRAPEWACADWRHIRLNESIWPLDGELATVEAVAEYLADRYVDMSENGSADIVAVLELLASPEVGPAIVHCAGGRDRTGVIMALTLELLGVADEVIAADYHLTERFTQRWLDWDESVKGTRRVLHPAVAQTPAAAILLFLGRLRERHGSVEAYLLAAGLPAESIESLRRKLL